MGGSGPPSNSNLSSVVTLSQENQLDSLDLQPQRTNASRTQTHNAWYDGISGTATNLLLLFWHVPLGVRGAIRRHQPPQRAILSQIDCFVQCKVVGSQVSLDGVQPRDTGTPWWSLPVLLRGAVRVILASVGAPYRFCPLLSRFERTNRRTCPGMSWAGSFLPSKLRLHVRRSRLPSNT